MRSPQPLEASTRKRISFRSVGGAQPLSSVGKGGNDVSEKDRTAGGERTSPKIHSDHSRQIITHDGFPSSGAGPFNISSEVNPAGTAYRH